MVACGSTEGHHTFWLLAIGFSLLAKSRQPIARDSPRMRPRKSILVVLCVVLAGCTYNPATGRQQLLLLSVDDAIALGAESKPAVLEQYGGAVETPQLVSYVDDVGHGLVRRTEADYPQLPWEFTVLDSDVVNAFALPGGKVFASRGLLVRLDNEAQLAGVLGHEVGHVTARHVNERISHAILIQGLTVGSLRS